MSGRPSEQPSEHRTRLAGTGVIGLVVALGLVACGAEPGSADDPAASGGIAATLPTRPPSEGTAGGGSAIEEAAAEPVDGVAVPAAAGEPELVPARQELDQPAIWPAPDVVFATPEEAAADFVSSVLIGDGDPLVGEFQPGDARSGEVDVLFAGEDGTLDPPLVKGTLIVRRLGPTDGWYVIAAVSDGVVIETPAALAEVPAGLLTVAGEGRGFEGTLDAAALPPGAIDAVIDSVLATGGGAFEANEPFSAELDLSAAAAGDVVMILVRGDTGLDVDPSTFAALPVVIAAESVVTIPATK